MPGMPVDTDVSQYMLFDSIFIMSVFFAFILFFVLKAIKKSLIYAFNQEKEKMEKKKEEGQNDN